MVPEPLRQLPALEVRGYQEQPPAAAGAAGAAPPPAGAAEPLPLDGVLAGLSLGGPAGGGDGSRQFLIDPLRTVEQQDRYS